MADFMDAVVFKDRGEGQKPFAHRIGSAKLRDDGGVDIWLDSLPIPATDRNGKLQVHIRVSPRREKSGGGGGYTQRQPHRPSPLDDLEDSPF